MSVVCPEVERCRKRIDQLRSPPQEAKAQAWALAERLLAAGHPAPWIFANEDAIIELEWHWGDRHLILELLGPEDGDFCLMDGREGTEGTLCYEDLPTKIDWVYAEALA